MRTLVKAIQSVPLDIRRRAASRGLETCLPNAELVRACKECGSQNLPHVSDRERLSEEGR